MNESTCLIIANASSNLPTVVCDGKQDNQIVTARKRSLEQGNIFTPVCHSVHRGRGLLPGGGLVQGGLVRGGSGPGGLCLLQEGACSGGVSAPGGVCAWWRPPRRLLLRAVRILLECILVSNKLVSSYKCNSLKSFIISTVLKLKIPRFSNVILDISRPTCQKPTGHIIPTQIPKM